MTGDRINPPSDQLKLTNETGSDKLQQRRKEANRFTKAREYTISQKGETSEYSNLTFNKDFTKDGQNIKKLAERLNNHFNQIDDYINKQDECIKLVEKEYFQKQMKYEKQNKINFAKNIHDNFTNVLDQNHQNGDFVERKNEYIKCLNNAIEHVFNEDFVKNWQDIKGYFEQMIGHIKQNNEHISFLQNTSLLKKIKLGKQDFLEQVKDDIKHLDRAITQVQQDREKTYQDFRIQKQDWHAKNQHLKSEQKKTCEDKEDLQRILSKHIQEKLVLKQKYQDLKQKYQALEQQHIREHELKEILKKAKPELSPEVKEAYDRLQDLHSRARHGYEVSNEEHRKAFEELLGHLSPETLQDYKSRGIEFVANPNLEVRNPMLVQNQGKWQLELPLPYKYWYGIQGMMLRTIELVLETERQRDGNIPSPERRAEIATRVLRANTMLCRYRCPIKGYKLAEKYHKDYKDGVRQAFESGLISENDSKEKLIEIGYAYAHDKFLESIKPPQDIPRVFPSMQPGAYFEEGSMWDIFERREPVKVGSPEFDKLEEKLKRRQQKEKNSALTVNILLNEAGEGTDIWVQPYYIIDGLRSRHPMNAQGTHSVWAGEADIDYENKKLLRLKDQSGHFIPYDKDNPDVMARFALEEFKKRGYDTSTTMIELTAIEGAKDLEYKNYKLPTREDLKDSGGRTRSEQYLEKFKKNRGNNETKDITQL